MQHNSLPRVAYFCMEYALHESLPIYAGGLGVLAGDILKSAKDLELPLIGVGILWREGYTKQHIGPDNWPYDEFPAIYTSSLQDTGVQVQVQVYDRMVPVRIWKTQAFGNVALYLLNTDVPGSDFGWITRRLYGGSAHDRIAQEIVLGIGGVRALRALDLDIQIYHFNEGHAVLAGLELIREKINRGLSFEEAWRHTRDEVVFTTHTPVMAGNESHSHDLLQQLGAYNGLTYREMSTVGGDPFSMTVAGLRLARLANAVSKQHGLTARAMWQDIAERAPILSITNGVHQRTWQNEDIKKAYEEKCDLWPAHQRVKKQLLFEITKRTGKTLDPEKLLIGFARRATPYKRSNLIFSRPEIISPLLEEGHIQLVFSGKAHPQDEAGKNLVSELIRMTQTYPQSVVFLENYDLELGRLLTSGCDLWLNTPQRPLEASGTSGMKAALNGVLNLSVLDGWWPEGCLHGVNGWQFGDGYEGPDQEQRDLLSLYKTLLTEVIPTYYRDRPRWQRMMRASIEMAVCTFTAARMLKEYYNLMYLPTVSKRTGIKANTTVNVTAMMKRGVSPS
ncbi:MAG: alpha-glucan family phosphorylase [Firmicutes bacterium]|nr:alpha-glucan family phosphorylase [Bacillota bacterium]